MKNKSNFKDKFTWKTLRLEDEEFVETKEIAYRVYIYIIVGQFGLNLST